VQESIPYLKKSVSLDPQNVKYLNNLGVAYFQSNNMDQAIAQFRLVLERWTDSWEVRYNLAMALLGKGEIDMAIEEFKTTIARNPKHAEAHYNLGMAYMMKSDLHSAIYEFEQALTLKPGWEAPRLKLTELNR
jgi:tetratricopeptide (TPR) repeat protein